MQLTPRQVNYDLKGIKKWLANQNVTLSATPGVGIVINCSPEQSRQLSTTISAESHLQLVLTAEQRQHLLSFLLLITDEPFILYQLQKLADVSRSTILKDLDGIAEWLDHWQVRLERRPNFGIWIEGSEHARRQATVGLLWGEMPFGDPLIKITHNSGLVFTLGDDADLLPIVRKTADKIQQWHTNRTLSQVAYVEKQFDGHFSDDAVRFLALAWAIQTNRIRQQQYISPFPDNLDWLKTLAVWPVAQKISHRLGWHDQRGVPESETAVLAMHILSAPRNERWPGDLDIDNTFTALIDKLMVQIYEACGLPTLEQDNALKDGLIAHIIPACLRHRFQLWMPSSLLTTRLPDKYVIEHELAHQLAEAVKQHTGAVLPDGEINNIAMLLRAAFIRERPHRVKEVIVVCPSGMATSQLLVARLKSRFPRLGAIKVISLREMNATRAKMAELIITTVPLPSVIQEKTDVIQVHPMLRPEDVEAITQWLA
ncbi:MAG: PRD domain-containing protein [Anaerolineales bacterium]|nr:PRD domain-containing protein [Anaerolineales bacterium]MCA9930032.1 PRD domain-containing protein [Anaerolineales bacterium]